MERFLIGIFSQRFKNLTNLATLSMVRLLCGVAKVRSRSINQEHCDDLKSDSQNQNYLPAISIDTSMQICQHAVSDTKLTLVWNQMNFVWNIWLRNCSITLVIATEYKMTKQLVFYTKIKLESIYFHLIPT